MADSYRPLFEGLKETAAFVQVGAANDANREGNDALERAGASIAQKADGSLWGWGSNREGQLGDPNDFLPRRVGTNNNWGCPP